jgi:SAM-dependent methyltransferase
MGDARVNRYSYSVPVPQEKVPNMREAEAQRLHVVCPVEVPSIERLAAEAEAFAALDRRTPAAGYHEVLAAVHAICAALLECEAAGYEREELVAVMADVRAIHARSPFVRRLQSWPRGYPGDFETVRYIMAGQNLAPSGTIEHQCERYALDRSIAQQHRNKVQHQAARILKTMFAKPGASRVLSLACGSCPDFERIAMHLPSLAGEIYLNDSDEDALAFSRGVVAGAGERVHVIAGNALRVPRRLMREAQFDLVLAGGLFDYLPASHAEFLIAEAYKLLAPGGVFYFTNIAEGNPYRPLIEYFGDWFLIERSEADVRALCRAAGVPEGAAAIRREETGLALLIEVTKE